MSERVFFSSHSFQELAAELAHQLHYEQINLFSKTSIIIPHPSMKEWLQIELCKLSPKKGIAGLEFISWQQAIQASLGSHHIPSRTELASAIWALISLIPCQTLLKTQQQKIDFVSNLADSFATYALFGLPKEANWQINLFTTIFQLHHWITYPDALNYAYQDPDQKSLFLFGADFLPSTALRFFLHHPKLKAFRFSPCAMFWEDLCSAQERKNLLKKWEKKKNSKQAVEALDALLRDTQPLLANWGSAGRKTLHLIADEEEIENYDLDRTCSTVLQQLKFDLLLLREPQLETIPLDLSIQCLQTGSSRMREVQILREKILHLAAQGIPFSSMRVYAPDISSYAPLIEFCFNDPEYPIPFRIAGLNLAHQSSFYQALLLFFHSVQGRWEAEDFLKQIEMPSFYKKAHWNEEDIEKIRDWIHQGAIRWGINRAHKEEIAMDGIGPCEASGGSWQDGLNELFHSWIFLNPKKEECLNWNESDLFQTFYDTFTIMQTTLSSWKKERTLQEWAKEIEQFILSRLFIDESSESDRLAKKSFFQFLDRLRNTSKTLDGPYPFACIQAFFFSTTGGEEGSSLLHAVRFAKLEEGNVLPAQALFLIGMDEESYPRPIVRSSLHNIHPEELNVDRYLLLQAVFAANEFLIFSFGHRSKEDGKAVSLSLPLQELLSYLDSRFLMDGKKPSEALIQTPPSSALDPRCFQSSNAFHSSHSVAQYQASQTKLRTSFFIPTASLPIEEKPEIETILPIQELSRFLRHPFQYYLKERLGISFPQEPESDWKEFEHSLLLRHILLRDSLNQKESLDFSLPLGLFAEVAKNQDKESLNQCKAALHEWGLSLASIHTICFKETCDQSKFVTDRLEYRPALKIDSAILVGEIDLAIPNGALYMNNDNISSLLRKWPELLCILVATGSKHIYSIKTGKIREVNNPLQALESLVSLFFLCKKTPLFLHPEWADELLRKKITPTKPIEDPVLQWVLQRSSAYDLEAERQVWQETLESAFASLVALFPTRNKHAEV